MPNESDQAAEEMDAPSKVDEVMSSIKGARDTLTVGRVFGDPYEVGDTTVIPVARVAGGAGGGGGESTDDEQPGSGFGSGFGLDAKPVGVYEIRDGVVTWKPAVDVTRLAKRGQALGGLFMVCATLVLLRRWS